MLINHLAKYLINMSTLEYTTEVIIVIFVYIFSEYVLIPMIIKPLSNTLKKRLTQYLTRCSHYLKGRNSHDITSTKSDAKDDDILYYYLVSKYLDDCEADRCAPATSLSLQYEKDFNGTMPSPYISSPNLVNRLFDECAAGRECVSSFHRQSMAYGDTFKPLPRRVVLLWGPRF